MPIRCTSTDGKHRYPLGTTQERNTWVPRVSWEEKSGNISRKISAATTRGVAEEKTRQRRNRLKMRAFFTPPIRLIFSM